MSSKGGDTQKVSNEPWGALQPYLTGNAAGKKGKYPAATGMLPEAEKLYKSGPGFYTPFDPAQTQSQNMALQYANNFGSMYSPYMQAGQFALNAPDLENNPYLEPYMQAATRPLEQQLAFGTLPGIRSDFIGSQGGGTSTRQGVAEGIAQGLTNQAIGDTRAKIASQAYGQGLDQQARALALYPQILQQGLTPSQIYGSVGAQRQGAANQQQTDPYQRLNAYAGILNPTMGGGYGTQTQPNPNQGNWLQDASSLAATAASLYSIFSDERLKDNVELIGEINGFNKYKWTWNKRAALLGLSGEGEGVMADEVELTKPEAVSMKAGYKVVDYGKL